MEEKVLHKLVPLVPSWISPDTLTFSAVIFAFIGGFFYITSAYSRWFLIGVNICLLLNWFTDSTDGKVAMYRKKSRPNYGYYIDHMMDAFSAVFLLGGLALSGLSHTPAYYFTAFASLLCLINAFLKTPLFKAFYISLGHVGPTDGRIYLFIVNVFVLCIGNFTTSFWGFKVTFIDMSGWAIGFTLVAILLNDIYKTAKQLNVRDQKKWL